MRRRAILAVAVTAAAMGLAACEGGQGKTAAVVGGDGLCKAFNTPAAAGMSEGGQAVDDCLHRWGYTLAKSGDEATAVAQAVVAACSAPLARWNQQSLTNAAASGASSSDAPSLLTGEPTNPIAEHANFADGRALFYVVQARAGKCDAPRAEDREAVAAQPAPQAPAVVANSPDR